MAYYATDGDVDLDGQAIRAQIRPRDSDGVSFGQVAVALAGMTNPPLQLRWSTQSLWEIRSWLDAGLGLVVDGYYGAIPRSSREQPRADFNHAIWIAQRQDNQYRVWDPLNKDLSGYGKWHPADAIEPFVRSLSGLSAWITLVPLAPPAEGNPLMNLLPTTCHRVVDLRAGTVLEETPGGVKYTTLPEDITLGVMSATGTHYYVADGDAGVYVKRTAAVVRTEDKNVGA